jgi:mannose-6-phosphate isomerase
MYAMTNPIQRYPWGSRTALSTLQRRAPSGEPEAELWMGAHPAAPSLLVAGNHDQGPAVSLVDLIAQDPHGVLGPHVLKAFGARLPFLVKVLAVETSLSLQVHPDPLQAAEGFAEEQAQDVPLNAPERRYPDASAKPEMLYALTEVEALCGFRDPTRSAALLDGLGVAQLVPIARRLAEGSPPEAIREVLAPAPDLAGLRPAGPGRGRGRRRPPTCPWHRAGQHRWPVTRRRTQRRQCGP